MFGETLFSLREKNNLSQQKLSDLLNERYKTRISKSMISRWEKNQTDPQMEYVRILSDYFKIPIDILYGNSLIDSIPDKINKTVTQLQPPCQEKVYSYAKQELKEQQREENTQTLPFHPKPKTSGAINLDTLINVAGKLSAGHGALNYDKEKPIKTVRVDYVPVYYDLAFEIKGDSMSPYYSDGEIVFVQETQDIHNGMLASVEINQEAFLKKIYFDSNRLRLVSLNIDKNDKGERLYPDFYADEFDNIHMIGRVVN